jgi:hypothetical protein
MFSRKQADRSDIQYREMNEREESPKNKSAFFTLNDFLNDMDNEESIPSSSNDTEKPNGIKTVQTSL